MPGQHALLSPSSAGRWLSCPASVRFIQRNAREGGDESFFAREGTAAHAVAETIASERFGKINEETKDERLADINLEFADVILDEDAWEDMLSHGTAYADLVQHLAGQLKYAQVFFEERLDAGVPEVWGTSDTVIVSPDTIHIVDFKYGQGVQVSPVENPQLRLYALGALKAYGDMLGTTKTVKMTIHQPRLQHTETDTMSAAALRRWRDEVAIPGAKVALSDSAPFGPSEDACRFCPMAGNCRARVEYMTEIDFGEDPDTISNEEMAELVSRIKDIRRWTDELEKEALHRAYSEGQHLPGMKVVMRGARMTIADAAYAIQLLIDAGYTAEQVVNTRTKSLGDLDKLVGGRKRLLELAGKAMKQSEGKPAIVPESDKGTPVTAETRAADDFSAEGKE